MTNTRDAFTAALIDAGYEWVAADHQPMFDETDREFYDAIIRRIDGDQAPGSETSLLGDALAADGYADDPVACLTWWLDAYRAQAAIRDRDPGETVEAVYDAIFSGDSAYALTLATA